ncbi:lysine-sensitive aspartokinase 3 [bacterium]|nr:lysine-sensitive aspartokinase 3 [bacterium]
MIVMKFGGTSLKDAEAVQRATNIIKSRKQENPIIVVSAMSGVTDNLLRLCKKNTNKNEIISDIKKRHIMTGELLFLHDSEWEECLLFAFSFLEEIVSSEAQCTPEISDSIVSTGEFLSANLLSANLRKSGINSQMADARDILLTDSSFGCAKPDLTSSFVRIKKYLIPLTDKGIIPVIQGFVGSDNSGRTTTLGRGGSDYSATIFGALLEADRVEIWSDVDGVLTADPSIISEARRIKQMTFNEAAELAYFGAKVLHPATLIPAIEKNIPVVVLNSMHPSEQGTLITFDQSVPSEPGLVKSIAYKEGITVITVTSTRMLMAYGFMSAIFKVFDKFETPVDLVTTSEVSVSITIYKTEHLHEIIMELKEFAKVEFQQNKAIVCVVGSTLKNDPSIMGRIFHLFNDVPIHMVSQGASEINISFVIDEQDIKHVVSTLHEYFFERTLNTKMFINVEHGA